jgi:hypothetical protein
MPLGLLSAGPGLIASSLSCCLPVGKVAWNEKEKVDMSDSLPMGNVGPRFLNSMSNKGDKLCSSLVKWRFNSGSMSRQIAKGLVVYSSPYESWANVLLSPFNSLAALGLLLGLSCDLHVSSPGRVAVLPAAKFRPVHMPRYDSFFSSMARIIGFYISIVQFCGS